MPLIAVPPVASVTLTVTAADRAPPPGTVSVTGTFWAPPSSVTFDAAAENATEGWARVNGP